MKIFLASDVSLKFEFILTSMHLSGASKKKYAINIFYIIISRNKDINITPGLNINTAWRDCLLKCCKTSRFIIFNRECDVRVYVQKSNAKFGKTVWKDARWKGCNEASSFFLKEILKKNTIFLS